MKKLICIFMSMLMVLSLSACVSDKDKANKHSEELKILEEEADRAEKKCNDLKDMIDEYESLK